MKTHEWIAQQIKEADELARSTDPTGYAEAEQAAVQARKDFAEEEMHGPHTA